MSREDSDAGGCGWTGVLVTVSFAGLLVGILLPAVMKVREVAELSSSQCHIGCGAKALHNFASASPDGESLPTGNWSDPQYPATGPFAAILPFIEQLPTTPPATTVKPLVSPVDRDNVSRPPGLSDCTYNPAWLGGPDEAWLVGRAPRLAWCADGTANTLLLSEQRAECGDRLNTWSANRGLDGVQGSVLAGPIAAVPPSSNFPGLLSRGSCTPDAPSGNHRGVILVAMGDASVRSVALPVARSDSRTPGVTNWQAAVTPAGKELLGEDW